MAGDGALQDLGRGRGADLDTLQLDHAAAVPPHGGGGGEAPAAPHDHARAAEERPRIGFSAQLFASGLQARILDAIEAQRSGVAAAPSDPGTTTPTPATEPTPPPRAPSPRGGAVGAANLTRLEAIHAPLGDPATLATITRNVTAREAAGADPASGAERASGGATHGFRTASADPTRGHFKTDPDDPLFRDGAWDGARVLRNLSQLDQLADTDGDLDRCSPAAFLAGPIQAGPEATARVADRLADQVADPAAKAEIQGIASRIRAGSATFADLSRLQEQIYDRYNADGDSGLTPVEYDALVGDLADGTRGATGTVTETPLETKQRIDRLQKGESFQIATDPGDEEDFAHAVTIGRSADGRLYAYNPWAPPGEPRFVYASQDPGRFASYANGGQRSWKDDDGNTVNVVSARTVRFDADADR